LKERIEDDTQFFPATNFLTSVDMYEDKEVSFGSKSGKSSPNSSTELLKLHLYEEDDDYIRVHLKKG